MQGVHGTRQCFIDLSLTDHHLSQKLANNFKMPSCFRIENIVKHWIHDTGIVHFFCYRPSCFNQLFRRFDTRINLFNRQHGFIRLKLRFYLDIAPLFRHRVFCRLPLQQAQLPA